MYNRAYKLMALRSQEANRNLHTNMLLTTDPIIQSCTKVLNH
jgi:hypothetical protein